MGASAYWYYVPYEQDFNAALTKLRAREFLAGRYNPVIDFPAFPVNESESPGCQHDSIQQAMDEAAEDGTRSILDLNTVSDHDNYCTARILSSEELKKIVTTDKPQKQDIENNYSKIIEIVDRGKGICIVIYKDANPDQLFFLGYSFD